MLIMQMQESSACNLISITDSASYQGSLLIAGEEYRAWLQSLAHVPIILEFQGKEAYSIATAVIFRLMSETYRIVDAC